MFKFCSIFINWTDIILHTTPFKTKKNCVNLLWGLCYFHVFKFEDGIQISLDLSS